MPTQTVSDVAHGVNYFYVRTMLRAAEPKLVHNRWAQVKDIPQGNTASIKFRRYSLLSANTTALTEGVTPSGKSLTVSNVTADVAQYGDFITTSDWLQTTTLDPLMTENARLLGQQAGNSLDQLTRAVLVAGTTIQYASTAAGRTSVTSSMKLTRDEIRQAVRTLQTNDAQPITSMISASDGFNTTPLMPCYVGIIHPKTYYDLKNETGWVPASEYPTNRQLMEGEVGAIDEVRFVMTTNAYVATAGGSGSIDVYCTLILGSDFYGISRISGKALEHIVKPLGSAGSADPLNQRATQGWKATHVAVRLNENFCVRVEHAVSS